MTAAPYLCVECEHGFDACPICDAPGTPAVSLWQPWASLLFVEDPELRKVHETRGRALPAKYVGARVAIHAALFFPPRLPPGLHDICVAALGSSYRHALPRGKVIGTLVFAGAAPTDETAPYSAADRLAGDWGANRWAWPTAAPRLLVPPVKCKGRQGWFSVRLPEGA